MNYFESNLACIEKRDPDFAQLMRRDFDCSHIEVVPSDQPGVLTAKVTRPDGRVVWLHNRKDPVGSAQRVAKGRDLTSRNGTVLFGLGLGYLAVELAHRMEPRHTLLICEQDPAIFRTALEHVDLSPVLDSDYIKILVGPDIPVDVWLHKLAVKFMTAEMEVITYQPSCEVDPAAYGRLVEIVQKEARAVVLNSNTTLRAGRRMMENALRNCPDVLDSAGVKHLKGLFAGRPAILVAAGPSLEKNVHLLKQVGDRVVIIAVDTALRLLLPLGIKPHIVTTIDFNRVNYEKFTNLNMPDDIALVFHPGAYPEGIHRFPGPRFTLARSANRIPAWLQQFLEDKGDLSPGTTVAHLSFHLARHMGCDPIVLMGQDLAFPQNKIHASDLSLWKMDEPGEETVEDIFGEQVPSMMSFKHAIYHFERAFEETKASVIDATEGGARKAGARPMRLEDVLAEYGHAPALDIPGRLREAATCVETGRVNDLLGELRCVSAELTHMEKDSAEILRIAKRLDRMIVLNRTGEERFARLTCAAERLTTEMDRRARILELMAEQCHALELYMLRDQVGGTDEIEDVQERARQQVQRALIYYPAIADACKVFRRHLDTLIGRLETRQRLEREAAACPAVAEPWYRMAQVHARNGDLRLALASLDRALGRDPDHGPAWQQRARVLADQQRWDEAATALRRAQECGVRNRRLQALEATVSAQQEAWRQRCARLRVEFLGERPAVSPEAAAWFYYRVKDYPRAVAKLEAAAAEHPTAGVFAKLGKARAAAGDVEGAVAAWERGLELDDARAELYMELGSVALAQGLFQQAETFLAHAVQLDPDDAGAGEQLAQLYLRRGAYVEAGLCYERLLHANPDRHELIPQIAALYEKQVAVAATTH